MTVSKVLSTTTDGATRKPHISDEPWTRSNWYKHINWLNVIFVVLIPLYGFIATFFVPLRLYTAIFAVFYYFNTGLGITAGYHRLWAHTSYKASLPLQIYLAAVGAGSVQGSIRWWSRGHRAHHRYTDTEKDPYSVRKGLMYSHIGWMVLNQDAKKIGRADVVDLNSDPIVRWQHKHYLVCVLSMAFIFPALVCGIWGDMLGGLVYAGIIRACFVQQATFCINSLAHWLGDQPFDDRNSPRDNWITALVTLGEGYHNYHHEFPSDFRNAIEWYQYDPTKWMITIWGKLGLASHLKQFRSNEVEKGRLQQMQKKLDVRRAKLDWGTPLNELPVYTWDAFVESAWSEGKALTSIAGVIHDVSSFINEHPGGQALIKSAIGKDATALFNKGIYDHSNAAHNLLATMRVGVLMGGCEVEIWKSDGGKKTFDGAKYLDLSY
ncbi:stearoyl-CoA desaturase [Pseudovirgaria hyperparasitica]|uniref:Acyl-CoA desaturase n=1 Tax=Pseudovirgaria hyperparasitica TaxID=470096 RepID=A0A6A6WIJ9_9PEZI|nr:stearoyl-CoA desaturase [Pseudovirgaria hyperparasitica]KAF2761846.1 stearoyl-CoA desaturase [Pseudovirgaria hyperparasitica]